MDFYVIMSISINSRKGVNVGAVNDVPGEENSHQNKNKDLTFLQGVRGSDTQT